MELLENEWDKTEPHRLLQTAVATPSYSGRFNTDNWKDWESDDGTLIGRETEERNEESLYSQDATAWSMPVGSVYYSTHPFFELNDIDIVQEANNRLTLLAKKYALERVNLDKEDNARLEMLNHTMDLKYPRYTAKDFEMLDEAEELLKEIEKIRGK